jgi:hypothetical protein
MSKYKNSSYWLQDWENDDILVDSMNDVEKKSLDLYKLASAKRAISNFVNIVTNQSVPVIFSQRGESYTDGKYVVIGSKVVEPSDFDVAVGLALHEGSHIKLSDFDSLKNIYSLIPMRITDFAIKKGVSNPVEVVKNLWNYVEDRRIDHYVFSTAPGYRDYYRAMYDKYFNDPLIDKMLLSDEYREESVESYMTRIINLHNKNTQLSALKGLREIYKIVGLGNIDRLKSTHDTLLVALEMFEVILNNLPKFEGLQDDDQQKGDESSKNQNSDSDMSDDEFEDLLNSIDEMDGENGEGGNSISMEGAPSNGSQSSSNKDSKNEIKLSDRQKELLKKKLDKQKDFLNGDIKKPTISKKEATNLEDIEQSGSEIVSVGDGVGNGWGNFYKGVECIVVKNLTRSLLESEIFPMTSNNYYGDAPIKVLFEKEVQEGIRLGTILGKKLQVRGEDRNTVFNRQKIGKIDKRMISSLGFGNENVFQYTEIDSYKKANLHVSIDASGSMGGSKWEQTITNIVALCKAVDMIQNLSIQVSFRTTSGNKPYVVLAYDSRKDKFSKVKQMFPSLHSTGTTPEGLCFEAIMKTFLPANNDMDSYFLNISDGEPYFEKGSSFYYSGTPAEEHTSKMVKKIEGMGIKTLAYFVKGRYEGDSSLRSFQKMYGKGAVSIDVTNVSEITKTMNRLFLSKN